MEYRTINNGIKMPVLGFGVFQVADPKICEESVLTAIRHGYRLIDTAAVYRNEEAVGAAIRKCDVPREQLFIVLCDSLCCLTARVRLLISLLGSDDNRLINCAVLIISIWILDCSGKLLSLKLLAYQILPSFLGDVPSAKLIGADPGDDFSLTGELQLKDSKGNLMPHAYLIAIMTVNDTVHSKKDIRVTFKDGTEIKA